LADVPASSRDRVIWACVVILIAIYAILFLSGIRFYVLKTVLLPVILLFGILVRDRVGFVADWLPFISGTLVYDAVRGGIWAGIQAGYRGYLVDYVILLERAVFGVDAATFELQAYRSPTLDTVAVLVHASHFIFFFVFGLALWTLKRAHFRVYRRAMLLVMGVGLLGYAIIPTAPPWAAADLKVLPQLTHITGLAYTHRVPEFYQVFNSNPVAAMPSLHVAFPVACALLAWQAWGARSGLVFLAYALTAMLASVYLGEHYAVDGIAGAILATVAVGLASRMTPVNLSFRASLYVSAMGLVLTVILVHWARSS
jgi:hypothetical protein